MRIDKFLSHTGFGSRKEVKVLLKKSNIFVNGQQVRDGKFSVNEKKDSVQVDGKTIVYQPYFYYLLHKPKGVVSATEDKEHRTVLDLVKQEDYRHDLFPVGRLDKDTTGLLLLTNDGELAHQLLSPKKHVAKKYRATIQGVVTKTDIELFEKGLPISGGEICKPVQLEIVKIYEEQTQSEVLVTLIEGKYHQVKRMFQAVDKSVLKLHRETMGSLQLEEELQAGMYRPLTSEEIIELKGEK